MYKYFLSLVILFTPGYQLATRQMSCCGKQANDAFVAFASNPAFVRAHPNPKPLVYKSAEGQDLNFITDDGKEGHGFLLKTASPSNKFLLVIHDYFGLGAYAKTESLKYFHDLGDVNVLAVDLYDRKVTTNRDSAAMLMRLVTPQRTVSILKGALKYTGPNAKIGTIGWCFGGGWSLQTALLGGKNTDACVVFYGMPETDVSRLKTLHSDVLGIFANRDKWITPEVVTSFEHNMALAGKNLQVKRYDADHGFGNPTVPAHDAAAAQDSYEQAVSYLKNRLL